MHYYQKATSTELHQIPKMCGILRISLKWHGVLQIMAQLNDILNIYTFPKAHFLINKTSTKHQNTPLLLGSPKLSKIPRTPLYIKFRLQIGVLVIFEDFKDSDK